MIPSLSIGPRTLLNDCNHSATALFRRSAIVWPIRNQIVLGAKTAVKQEARNRQNDSRPARTNLDFCTRAELRSASGAAVATGKTTAHPPAQVPR